MLKTKEETLAYIISELIQKRKWKKVLQLLKSNSMANTRICHKFDCKYHVQSPLLLACKNNPPVKIVDLFLKKDPYAVFSHDCDERLPLHLACQYGASPEVIKKLVRMNKKAVIVKDKFGMLPIHLACRFYGSNKSGYKTQIIYEKHLMQVLSILLKTKADTVLEEDSYGISPIEHALESDLSMYIVRALQRQAVYIKERELELATQLKKLVIG